MKPHRIVTLLTDFGTRDGYVAALKGVLLSTAPQAVIVDAAHDLAPQDVAGAAWVLRQYAMLYPPGTIHVAVVDPGVGTARRALCVEADQRFFLAPDNGLLWWVLRAAGRVTTHALRSGIHRPGEVSATFHGRDIFAHAAGLLAQGVPVTDLAEPFRPEAKPEWGDPTTQGEALNGSVIHIDRFGNLITNIAAEALRRWTPERLVIRACGAEIRGMSRTFADVAPGGLVAYVGSGGTVEIAINRGSAAEALKARSGMSVVVSAETTYA